MTNSAFKYRDRSNERTERGAAALLVASMLLGIIGVAALALDGSNAYR